MKNIQQYRIPQDGMYKTNPTNYSMKVDIARQIPALHAFIWGDGVKQLTSLPDEEPDPTATPVPTGHIGADGNGCTDSNDNTHCNGSTGT